eukprot:scaffold2012_cov228-Pinguiococcus_pyrenoidosus.AAC.11
MEKTRKRENAKTLSPPEAIPDPYRKGRRSSVLRLWELASPSLLRYTSARTRGNAGSSKASRRLVCNSAFEVVV